MSSHYEAILFDFDGVIVDSEPVHYQAWCDLLAPLGVILSWDEYCSRCVGVADEEMFPLFGARAAPPRTVEEIRELFPRKKIRFRELMEENPPGRRDIQELLRSLSGYRLAVVTSSSRYEVEPLLEALEIRAFLCTVVYGDDVERLKPAPDPYRLAAKRLGVTRALVVEDSQVGLESGRAAGFDVLHLPEQRQLRELLLQRLNHVV